MPLEIKTINNVKDFYSSKAQWEKLLSQSQANKLFLSWQWQHSWWQTWGEKLELKLMILQAYDGAELVGLAPLYLEHAKLKGIYPLKRMQFIGNAWGKVATVRTEYLEFIANENMEETVCEAFIQHISELGDWDEFVLCDVPKTSATFKHIKQCNKKYQWYLPESITEFGVKINTLGDFEQYISLIGRNTRLKLYNRRKYLQGLKDVEIKTASEHEVDEYLSILNHFHDQRWSKPCFRDPALSFHHTLIKCLNGDQKYELSCISVDSKPVSLIYNLSANDTCYNIQAGYIENYDKKLSLGTLHLGYSIEQAFNDNMVTGFDLLIGSGKNEFYKNRYKGDLVEFETLRIVRNNAIKLHIVMYSLLPDSVKSTLSIILHKLKSIF